VNGDAGARAAAGAGRSRVVAIACVALWIVAATIARVLGVWLAVGGAAIALGAAVWAFDRNRARQLLRPGAGLIAVGAVAGGAMTAVTHLLYPEVARHVPSIAADTAALYAAFRAPSQALAAIALVPVVIGEELVWRGAVQSALARPFGRRAAVFFAAGAYALAHAPIGSAVLVAVALLCGIVWGALRAASKSLLPPLVAHLVWDALVLLGLPLDRA
jgi:membrane protease YdiL (CAAX protease family)